MREFELLIGCEGLRLLRRDGLASISCDVDDVSLCSSSLEQLFLFSLSSSLPLENKSELELYGLKNGKSH